MTGVDDLEGLRRSYRPTSINLLFIGESPPAGGTFFYLENSNLYWATRSAFVTAKIFGADQEHFLEYFRDRGCYLVDLCKSPVNGLDAKARRIARNAGIDALATALTELTPRAVVATPIAIRRHVEKSLKASSLRNVGFNALPFPAFSHKPRYVSELSTLLPLRLL